jgi:hypothetical protein
MQGRWEEQEPYQGPEHALACLRTKLGPLRWYSTALTRGERRGNEHSRSTWLMRITVSGA